ncbi:hypothetical protein MKW94_030029 [Papaver nudicaule]|uniref:Hexosyltransferase n=1 Tax=Papaver nudicaule TaxID=74823 RepID=A0AA41V9S6_PAPNU|nr:hypothetical protein [Papaver nudicaule]
MLLFWLGIKDYVKCVTGLTKGLGKVKAAYPLVVAVLPDVPQEHRNLLEQQGCIVREIEPVYPPENQTQFAMAYYFVEYSKMIFLDGDIQVFENIDHHFYLPNGYFYTVMDCFCEKEVKWPADMGAPPSLYFNAGLFLFEPNLCTYHDLLKQLKITPTAPFAEQNFLNVYFRDTYKPIPPVYNLVLPMLWRHTENVELDEVKVVHYCAAGSNPWKYTGEEENMQREDIKMVVKKWRDIYSDESLDYRVPVK